MSALTALPRFDRRSPLAAALAVFALSLPVLALVQARSGIDYELSPAAAERIARADLRVNQALDGSDVTEVRVTPLDDRHQRVSFFEGPRVPVEAAVRPGGVSHVADYTVGRDVAGSSIVNRVPMLLGLTVLFVLATATLPLLSLRNLDVLALAGFSGVIVLLNQNLVLASNYVAYPLLAYLAARCLARGFGAGAKPSTPLLWQLARQHRAEGMRLLKLTVAAACAVVLMVVPSSTGATDVAFALGAGATDLLNGTAPYGHIPSFIFHGDTYPLLSYVLFIPGALLVPVHDAFSDPTGALLVAAVAVLIAAAGLYRIGVRLAQHSEADSGEPPQFAGLRLTLAWLCFPALLLSASGGTNDPVVAACLVAAFACFARRGFSAFLLGFAAWVKVVPVLALPIWLARMRPAGVLRTVGALAAFSAALVAWLMALGGTGAVTAMLEGLSFQLERGSLHSLWVGVGLGPLRPAATAFLLAAAAAATVTAVRDPSLRDDLRRMAALFAGLMLLAQIAANYWTWAYLPWVMVPLLLSLLAPSTAAVSAPAPAAGTRLRPSPAQPVTSAG